MTQTILQVNGSKFEVVLLFPPDFIKGLLPSLANMSTFIKPNVKDFCCDIWFRLYKFDKQIDLEVFSNFARLPKSSGLSL